jgi:hypothetical protein
MRTTGAQGDGRRRGWRSGIAGAAALAWLALALPAAGVRAESGAIPLYIRQGLEAYAGGGAEAAIGAWFDGSPWQNAAELLSRVAYFQQIESLHGRYRGWTPIETRQTRTSQWTYLRLDFERLPVYLGFTSLQYRGGWALYSLSADTRQRFGVLAPPRAP